MGAARVALDLRGKPERLWGAMAKISVRDLSVRGKKVLVRVDFNVPTEEKDGAEDSEGDTAAASCLTFGVALCALEAVERGCSSQTSMS